MLLLCIVETGPGFKFRSVATIRMKYIPVNMSYTCLKERLIEDN